MANQMVLASNHNPIKVFQDGSAWCALLGANLMEGEAGFGDTPMEALQNLLNLINA